MRQSAPRPGDREREIAALELASGSGDPFAEHMLHQRRTRALQLLILLVVVCTLIGLLVPLLYLHSGKASGATAVAQWRTVTGPALTIAGFVLEFVFIIRMFRSGRIRSNWRTPSLVLSRQQRRQLLRQIRGRAAVDPRMLPVSRRLADILHRQRSVLAFLVAAPTILLGRALPHDDPFAWVLASVLTVLYAIVSGPILRDSRRAGAFLAQHPSPPPVGRVDQFRPWT